MPSLKHRRKTKSKDERSREGLRGGQGVVGGEKAHRRFLPCFFIWVEL